MCRLLGYLGPSLRLDHLLSQPEHSLVVQSYQPREMNEGLMSADGFGFGWYPLQRNTDPFTYKNLLPIWNDANLPHLTRYIESDCVLASVRSATPGLAVDMSNCQPFHSGQIMAIHNGYIKNFRQTLYRPIRDRLTDKIYQDVQGITDSEHIFALLMSEWQATPNATLTHALHKTLQVLTNLMQIHQVAISANLVVSDGQQLVASRFASGCPTPSLYWLRDDPSFPDSVIVASEPMFEGDWHSFPECSVLTVGDDLDVQIQPFQSDSLKQVA